MKIASLLLGAALLSLTACNDRPKPAAAEASVASQDRPVPAAAATAMEIAAPLNLHIAIGSTPSCRLKGPSRVISRIKTEMAGNTFRIFTESRVSWNSEETAEAWVTIPHLQALRTAGAGDIVVESRIVEPAVTLDFSGAVNLDIAGIQTEQLNFDLGGAGNVLVRGGDVGNARLEIAGTGNIDAFELKIRNAAVSVAGAGRAAITATERLDASIAGTGMIRYKGNPAVRKNISGIGTLQDAN